MVFRPLRLESTLGQKTDSAGVAAVQKKDVSLRLPAVCLGVASLEKMSSDSPAAGMGGEAAGTAVTMTNRQVRKGVGLIFVG